MVHSSLSPKLLRRYTLRLSYLEYIANCVHLASCLATVSYPVTLKPFGLSRCALGAFAKYQYFSGTQSAHPCDTVSCAYRKRDRKSTRLNSSHVAISYAVFCLKKKKKQS